MAIDIYARNSGDPNFVDDQVEIYNELDLFLQQIELTLLTDKTEVLGSPGFGASLESYIHTLNFPTASIEREITDQINTYCSLSAKFTYSVSVQFYRGETRDIGVVDILIEGNRVLGFVVN